MATVIGVGVSAFTRRPRDGVGTHEVLADALAGSLADAGIAIGDVDGLAVSSFSLAPDHAIDLAWRCGLSLGWLVQDTNGGSSGVNMLGHAARAVDAGDASVVVVMAGDARSLDESARHLAAYNRTIRDYLSPLGHAGPNSLFALLTQRQMRAHGLTRSDYGELVVAQRAWAAGNPLAIYRDPLTVEEYLQARPVADPLGLLDCVPYAHGAIALVVAADDRASGGVRVRAVRRSFNHDHQTGDGLRTGLSTIADDLWATAGLEPRDMDLACVYDDYPAMVLAQLADLGFCADGDYQRLVHKEIAERTLPVNTSGGMLNCGQAGAAGGMVAVLEGVQQLRGRAGERQIADARHAVVTGYGMVLYRYGANSTAAVLEAVA